MSDTLNLLYPVTILSQTLPKREGLLPAAVVLRDMGPAQHHRYVVHMRYASTEEMVAQGYAVYAYEHGQYSDDLRAAMENYIERAAERIRVAVVSAYDLPPAPQTPPVFSMPLAIAQAAYGLLDEAEDDLRDGDFDHDMVAGTVEGLKAALGRENAGYRPVQDALNATRDAAQAKRLAKQAQQA